MNDLGNMLRKCRANFAKGAKIKKIKIKKIPCVFAVLWYSINMIKTNNTEYVNTLNAFRAGEITEQEWREFCFEVLKEALEVNKDVLIRLKNC